MATLPEEQQRQIFHFGAPPLVHAESARLIQIGAGHRVAVIETDEVRVIRLGDIDLAHAIGEGEGHSSVAEWRAGHELFWHSAEVRSELGDPVFTIDDDTLVVAQTFSLLER